MDLCKLTSPLQLASLQPMRSARESRKVDYPGGDLAGRVGASTTMPSAAWQPLLPDPGVEEWINWACSVSKPKPMGFGINAMSSGSFVVNGQVLASRD